MPGTSIQVKAAIVFAVLLTAGLILAVEWNRVSALLHPWRLEMTGRRSVDDVVHTYGEAAMARLRPALEAAGFAPDLPESIAFVGLKEEKSLELWGRHRDGAWRLIKRYPVLAASGVKGPKLKEGDRQVPEGRYPITFLNPNSRYHLSLRVGYPSAEDRRIAAAEGRDDLGGDIMIHGRDLSIGCLAMGDPAIEEIFVLAAKVGLDDMEILLLPHDLRQRPAADRRPWVQARYDALSQAVTQFR